MKRIALFVLATALALAAQVVSYNGFIFGTVTQSDDNHVYNVNVTLNGQTGTIDHPSLNCGGTLTFKPTNGVTLYTEHITYGTTKCIDGGTIQITPDGVDYDFRWVKDGIVVSGKLSGTLN